MYLHRDWWYFEKDEYDEDPDDEDYKIPFLADPRDFATAWGYTRDLGILQQYELMELDAIVESGFNMPSPYLYANETTAYETFNNTIVAFFRDNAYGAWDEDPTVGLGIFAALGDVALQSPLVTGLAPYYAPGIYDEDYVFAIYYLSRAILQGSAASINFGYPSKTGYLMSVLLANQPMYVPQADFIAKLVDEFDLNEDALVKLPALVSQSYLYQGSSVYIPVYANVDIYTEGVAIIIEVEYQDEQIDPADSLLIGGDGEDELDDFEIVLVYSDTGGPSSIEFKDGDEVFWKQEAVSAIPGYEVHILLGASAITVIGLIFVIMKKRKM
jgi:hypothetical protein